MNLILLLCILFCIGRTGATAVGCAGDCNGDGEVTVDEVVAGVNIALGLVGSDVCSAIDTDASSGITVDELVTAITNALDGCPRLATPTWTPPTTATPTETATPTGTMSPAATPTPSPSVSASATATPSTTATASASATPSATVSASPSATASATASPTGTASASASATSSASVTPTATVTVTPTVSATATASPDIPTPEPVPTAGNPLYDWLVAGNYLHWPSESALHPSAGPHLGIVRTYLSPTVFASLQAGLPSHPRGSALVKELYGPEPTGAIRGWSVMVKVEDDSDGGRGWYWYERFDNFFFADGFGSAACTGCHSLGQDYVRAPFPLQ